MKKTIFIFVAILLSLQSLAQLHMPKIFGNNMVLQRGISIPMWGHATKNQTIVVQINNKSFEGKTDSTGNWNITVDSMQAGGPYTLSITEKHNGNIDSTIQFQNVMIGDVWLASGQSNMEMKLSESLHGKDEIAHANYPNIRFFQVAQTIETEPQNDVNDGQWQQCDSARVGTFSAVAYYFAKQIHREQNVAIGIIQSTWGGTPVETWTSKEALITTTEYNKKIQENLAQNINQASFIEDKENEKKFFDIAMNSVDGEKLHFTETSFNDSMWDTVSMPKTYGDTACFYDIMWLRKSIEIPNSMIGKDLKINLGYPEILYSVYFNGKPICKNKWNAQKQHDYKIPAELVTTTKNVITLRIAVIWGGGGIAQPADSLYITDGIQTISLAGIWRFTRHVETPFPHIKNYHKYPSYLYNGMIHPLIPYALKGFLWYQGEENAANPKNYAAMFQLMINDWRNQWQQGNIPFIYVQLPNFMKGVPLQFHSNWALLREAQLQSLSIPNTAMAVTIDVGQADDIHPKNKADVGLRLALAANHIAYNKQVVYSGPQFETFTIHKNLVQVSFKNQNSKGLKIVGNTLTGFEMAGADKIFYTAQATIQNGSIVVSCTKVPNPVAVRYGWADNPDCNLYNAEGLPASPFRTDSW